MNEMDTFVVWAYLVGFSIPLLGSVFVLTRSIRALFVSGIGTDGGLGLIKVKPLATIFVALGFFILIILALLLVVFFVIKFVVSGYSFPLLVDMAGYFLFMLYIFGFGILIYSIAGRLENSRTSGLSLSRCLVEMVTEKVMGNASTDG